MGLGKNRTVLGNFLDQNKLSQKWLSNNANISRDEISDLCNGDKNVQPRETTQTKIISALRRHGFDVKAADFW